MISLYAWRNWSRIAPHFWSKNSLRKAHKSVRTSHTSTLIGKLKGAPEEFDALEQHQEQVAENKAALSNIRHYVLSECPLLNLMHSWSPPLSTSTKLLFDISLSIHKKTVKPPTSAAKSASNTFIEAKMVKLPILNVPHFQWQYPPMVDILGTILGRHTWSLRHHQIFAKLSTTELHLLSGNLTNPFQVTLF